MASARTMTAMTSVPEQEVLDDVTPAQHEKKLQGATPASCSQAKKLAAQFSIPYWNKMPLDKLRTELHHQWMQRMPYTTAIALLVAAPSPYPRVL